MTKIQKILVGLVGIVAVIALVVSFNKSAVQVVTVPQATPAAKLAGADIVEQYPSFFTNGINIGQRFDSAVKLQIQDGKNQAFWQNTTGQTVFVKDFAGYLVQSGRGVNPPIASTTLSFFAGTSTAATLTDGASPVFGSIIDTYLIATSSTNNVAINSLENQGTNGQQIVPVRNGQYVVIALENPYNQACTGSTCETATSTNRGYNLTLSFDYFNPNN